MNGKLFDDRTDKEKALVTAREKILKRKLHPDEEKRIIKRTRHADPWAGNKFYSKNSFVAGMQYAKELDNKEGRKK